MAFPFFFLLAVLSLAATAANGATSTTCTPSQLAVNLTRIPFNFSSPVCSPVWDTQDFVLLYQREGSKTWSFVLSAPKTTSYIAIGFSPDGTMVGSSAVVGWLPGKAKQYYLGGKSPPEVVADKGNLTLAPRKTSIFSDSSRLYLTFQLTDTDKPSDKLIYAIGPTPGANNELAHHTERTSTPIVYASEGAAPSPTATGSGEGTGTPPAPGPGSTAGKLALSSIPAISTVLAMLLL